MAPRHNALLILPVRDKPPTMPAPSLIKSVKTDHPVVALTFDDGPLPGQTQALLDLFAREKIKVTFFEIGDHVAKHPALARAIHAAGHELANHSKTHPDLGKMTDAAAIRDELVATQAIIKETIGVAPVIFRAPYISHGPALWTVLDELQLPSIGHAHAAYDWDTACTQESITERCSQAGPGEIVLLHTWSEKSAAALPAIIANLRAKGLRFVTVSELLTLAPLRS